VERRFILFLVLAFLILMTNALVSALLFPRQQPVAQKNDDAAKLEKPEKQRAKPEKPQAPADDQQPRPTTSRGG